MLSLLSLIRGQLTTKKVLTIRVDVFPKSSIRLFNKIPNGCGIFQLPKYKSSIL